MKRDPAVIVHRQEAERENLCWADQGRSIPRFHLSKILHPLEYRRRNPSLLRAERSMVHLSEVRRRRTGC